jgi:hypothetical protein
MDELGIEYTRKSSQEEIELNKERDAQLKVQYAKIRAKAVKG